MTRVSENSHTAAIELAMNRAKRKLEDLQLKGSNLKRMVRPSDDPLGNLELLKIRATKGNNDQFVNNTNYATIMLEYTEKALEELTDILVKAKEVSIAQSSDLHNAQARISVSKEIDQLLNQVLSISNRKIGNRYIFGGQKTLTRPFNSKGEYSGDGETIYLEVLDDFFIPTNLPGNIVFFQSNQSRDRYLNPLKDFPDSKISDIYKDSKEIGQVSKKQQQMPQGKEVVQKDSIFSLLSSLINSLLTDNADVIQNLLNDFDDNIDRLITLRTQVGSTLNTIKSSEITIENNNLINAKRKSVIEDADVAELFSDLQRQQALLKATYKTGATLMNNNLLNFLK